MSLTLFGDIIALHLFRCHRTRRILSEKFSRRVKFILAASSNDDSGIYFFHIREHRRPREIRDIIFRIAINLALDEFY